MKAPIGFFWHARQSQIYSELARLEEQGQVSYQVIEQQDRPDKKLYSITESGRAALREWVTEPVKAGSERNELLLKTYALWLADPAKALKRFQEQADLHAAQLAEYERRMALLEDEQPDVAWQVDTPAFGDYATLLKGIGYERECVAWCRWMVERLEQHLRRRT